MECDWAVKLMCTVVANVQISCEVSAHMLLTCCLCTTGSKVVKQLVTSVMRLSDCYKVIPARLIQS